MVVTSCMAFSHCHLILSQDQVSFVPTSIFLSSLWSGTKGQFFFFFFFLVFTPASHMLGKEIVLDCPEGQTL